MNCTCGGTLVVKDGRLIPEGYWRRRRCDDCSKEYTTLEQFCVTERGTRTKQPVVKAEKPPVVKAVKPRIKEKKPAHMLRQPLYVPRKEAARNRIEDLKWEKANESIFDDR